MDRTEEFGSWMGPEQWAGLLATCPNLSLDLILTSASPGERCRR